MSFKVNTSHIAITDGVDGYFGDARVYTEYGSVLLPPAVGEVAGYTSGGYPPVSTAIDKFPFATSPVSATNVGSLTQARMRVAGQSSSFDGYTSGGLGPPPTVTVNTIDRFPFTTPFTTATDIGDLSLTIRESAGQSSSIDGYNSGGTPGLYGNDTINRFPFSTPFITATDIGNLSQARRSSAGQSSSTTGYTSGGMNLPPGGAGVATIDSFPFSTPFVTGTNIGSLTQGRYAVSGLSSTTDGYSAGGYSSFSLSNTIDKFPFSTPFTTGTDVGDLTASKRETAGQASSTNGYVSGGNPPATNTIDRFPFSTPSTVTNIGSLSSVRHRMAGHQD